MDKYFLQPEDTVLLLVDIQERLLPAMRSPKRIVANINYLLEAARAFQLPVYVSEQYRPGLGATVEQLDFSGLEPVWAEKLTFSAANDSCLQWLESTRRNTVLIAGMETHVCVYQTVRGLLRAGFHCHLVEDAVSSRSRQDRDAALALLRDQGAIITTTEIALFDLLHEAKTEPFRRLSPLLRDRKI